MGTNHTPDKTSTTTATGPICSIGTGHDGLNTVVLHRRESGKPVLDHRGEPMLYQGTPMHLAVQFLAAFKGTEDLMTQLHAIIEQIGDESLVGAIYETPDLVEQLRAGLARNGFDYHALPESVRKKCVQRAKDRLEEDWGLICGIPED